MTKLLDSICGASTGLSIIALLENAKTILSIVASLIAIISGIISIWLKIKKAAADGEITEDEFKEINEITEETIKKALEEIEKEKK